MNKIFPILAIETSGDLCSVAAMMDEKCFFEININQKHIHSEKIIDMIDYVISISKTELKNFSQIAVSIGPGSFTGLRIGLSVAKGLALGSNLPIVPVPSIDALALEISDFLINKKFGILKSASLEDLYYATFESQNKFYKKLDDASLIKKESLEEKIKGFDIIFADKEFVSNVRIISGPRAIYIAKWSYLFGQELLTYDYDYLEPYYLKQFKVRGNE
ncbi:tRNA (adenosine(37)-N6)-threonylcarbamoyltransferase complex dimerization subunit type 1 TsaB [Rosettibacter firmus]|uniref:tRNA (adenosine(37)-N6)-threonylcarbamoyltransferase complex dimerization subunit type 1 TsaB n=1 Tax=Rosettibacter firmus TaxID=3111522 RepID=UPI00336BE506